MPIEKLAVIGAGTMGRGIAECAAAHGLQVLVVDPFPEGPRASSASTSARRLPKPFSVAN